MSIITLHRGIAVAREEAERINTSIRGTGMSGTETKGSLRIPDISEVRNRLDALFAKPDLTRDDILAVTPFGGIYACGTPSGAAYYAVKHNFSAEKANHSIVIEFTARIDEVYVDCRDFLCTAFQLWDRGSVVHREWQSEVLCDLFGSAILRYFVAACSSSNQAYRIAMCNLAAFDPAVVKGHIANKKVILGRYNTRFSSAFVVKTPVPSGHISRLYTPRYEENTSVDIRLQDFIKRPPENDAIG